MDGLTIRKIIDKITSGEIRIPYPNGSLKTCLPKFSRRGMENIIRLLVSLYGI